MATKRIIRRQPAPAAAPPVVDEEPAATNGGGYEEEHEASIRGGWTASDEVADSTSNYAQTFRPDSKSQVIKFLDGKPYASFRRHWIDRTIGKRAYTCYQHLGKDCPLCDVGDKAGAVTAFNVALLGDDGEATLKSWEVGVKLTKQLKAYANDPKIGPLDKPSLYFLVSKSEASQRQQVTTMVNPVRERDLLEDYGIPPLSEAQVEKLKGLAYSADIVDIPKREVMDEVAAEIAGADGFEPPQRTWGD